ncbi:hypothetical protein NDU88_003728 [Pleurodeles waltl]|uniref:Uncharacterized protein n=1 Tax=Pleurodeles waltl TaxID=8319 RepID=A0AAV7M5H4_PLEWA|nr:hypothetical protein NDU88_003728 [Pleurodeles waltl]
MEIGVTRHRVLCTGKGHSKFKQVIKINGNPIDALIDSGCRQSVIRRDLLDPTDPTPNQWVTICCIHGDKEQYPLALVKIEWGEYHDFLPVGIMDRLIEDCIIGTDYIRFYDLLDQT